MTADRVKVLIAEWWLKRKFKPYLIKVHFTKFTSKFASNLKDLCEIWHIYEYFCVFADFSFEVICT